MARLISCLSVPTYEWLIQFNYLYLLQGKHFYMYDQML